MAIIRSADDEYLLQVDPTFDSVRVAYRGPEADAGGYYRVSLLSGTITALAAGSIFFAFQYTGTGKAVVTNVNVGGRPIAGNTSTSWAVGMWFTRSYTVLDTTGAATAISYKGQLATQTRSTQMNSFMRISNTGAMSGGTGTDDSQPLATLIFTHPGSVSTMSNQTMFTINNTLPAMPAYPVVFAQNEGFRLRADTTPIAGTNTLVLYVDVEWFESNSF